MHERRWLAAVPGWLKVILLALIAAVALGIDWSREAPAAQGIGSYYERGLTAYREGRFEDAINELGRAAALKPDDVGVQTLLGWSYWRLADISRARFHFARALDADPSAVDAQTGLAFASLAENDLATARPLLEKVARLTPDNRDVFTNLAIAYVREGRNRDAARVYREMLARDAGDDAARRQLFALYGFPRNHDDRASDVEPAPRPAQLEQWFRTRGNYLEALDGGAWRPVYLAGANLGPARPGEFPSTMSRDYEVYAEWLQQFAGMHANTVRVYTILPPAFYQALAAHNRSAAQPIWLIQEIWVHDEAQDLYDPELEREFVDTLKFTIDLLHGRGDVPFRSGAQFGLYTADVSRWVIGLAVGREIEPHLALRTNAHHRDVTSHQGRFVMLERGTPTEAWFARMCDLAAQYELDTYNAQRPITVVNWPPLDPLTHPTEASFAEEVAIRQRRGERVSLDAFDLPEFPNDSDVVSVDVTKFRAAKSFSGGLFALYHVYQHWPDFMFHEERFASARDEAGVNRYLGYLRALKEAHRDMPLVIGEYGLATSVGAAHLHPDGWHNGGFTEQGQAELLARLTRNQHDAGAAGSLIFAWKDEWWKRVADHFTSDFEIPRDRDPLWFNALDPEEAFGVVGYKPAFPVPLLRGRHDDWVRAVTIAESPDPAGQWRAVRAMTDYAYLYLRLDVRSIDWTRHNVWIALNTLPGRAGTRTLPGLGLRLEEGANFLVQLAGPGTARVLVADNYTPNHRVAAAGFGGQPRILRKFDQTIALTESAPFVEIVTEANQPRFSRSGQLFPAREYIRGALVHGTADRDNPAFTDHASWRIDPAAAMIELRIPWSLLLVTDPSSRQVYAGTSRDGQPRATQTPGVAVAVLLVSAGAGEHRELIASLPAPDGSVIKGAPAFAWQGWETVDVRPYFKRAYASMASLFENLTRRR